MLFEGGAPESWAKPPVMKLSPKLYTPTPMKTVNARRRRGTGSCRRDAYHFQYEYPARRDCRGRFRSTMPLRPA